MSEIEIRKTINNINRTEIVSLKRSENLKYLKKEFLKTVIIKQWL